MIKISRKQKILSDYFHFLSLFERKLENYCVLQFVYSWNNWQITYLNWTALRKKMDKIDMNVLVISFWSAKWWHLISFLVASNLFSFECGGVVCRNTLCCHLPTAMFDAVQTFPMKYEYADTDTQMVRAFSNSQVHNFLLARGYEN